MLGKVSSLDNSIFLSVRWAALCISLGLLPLHAQSALRSENFIIYSDSSSLKLAEQGLARLELLRTAIQAIDGPDWTPDKTIAVWLPRSESAWRALATRSAEQGMFVSSLRRHWIVVNPATPNFTEVLSHEYVHAVLHHKFPNLPTWFAEGVFEYYSTLTTRGGNANQQIVLGLIPKRHEHVLRNYTSISLKRLRALETLSAEDYALAWAAAYHLWPTYNDRTQFPDSLRAGPFPPRFTTARIATPPIRTSALSPAEIRSLQIEFANTFAKATAPAGAAEAESLFLAGLKLSDEGRNAEAAPLLEKACNLDPSNSTWWHALALAHKELGRIPEARAALLRAMATALNDQEREAAATLLRSLPQ